MPSPDCSINGAAAAGGVTVAAGSTVTIQLLNLVAARWTLECFGTDENRVAATISAGVAINQTTKTATFTADVEDGQGQALLFRSQVDGGVDLNGVAQPSYTTTFGVYVLAANGLRIGALNETTENSSSSGWLGKFNAGVRGATGSGGDVGPVIYINDGDPPTTLVVNTLYLVDATGAPIPNLTMPASPGQGARVTVKDWRGGFDTNNCPVVANAGQKLEIPGTPGTFTAVAGTTSLSAKGASVTWMFEDGQVSWVVV